MKNTFPLLIIILYCIGCTNKKPAQFSTQRIDSATNSQVSFFPVTSFIKGQLLLLDSLPVTPLLITSTGEKTDSQWLKRDDSKKILQTFLTPEINDSNLIHFFKESRFNDQTLNLITFTYTPVTVLPDSIKLISWNVYINPTSGKVTRIYLLKNIKENNQDIIQELSWHTDRYAEITNILNNPGGKSVILKKEKFIWDFDH